MRGSAWLCLLGVSACAHRAPESKPDTAASASPVSSSANSVPVTAAATADPIRYTYSASSETTLTFVGSDISGRRKGSFGKFNGTIVVSNGSPEQASVTVEIDVTSLRADPAELETQLKSASFLNVAKYPSAHFESTSVVNGGKLGATDTVKGNLLLRGVRRPVEIPATIHVRPTGVDVDAELTIQRKDFGLVFPGKRDALVKDDIVLSLQVVATAVTPR